MKLKKNVLSKIKSNLDVFTKTEKKIAHFIIENDKEIAFCSINDLSQKLNVGRASILRFASKLDYDGYTSLKKAIIIELKNDITPLEKYKISFQNNGKDFFAYNQIAQNEVENINYSINNLDRKSLDRSIKYILEARNIYVAGVNLSSYFAGIMSYLLQRIGMNSFSLSSSGSTLVEQIINISNKDLLIAFSLPDYSQGTIDTAKFAQKQKSKVISITNSITAPIIPFSNVNIVVKTESYFFSNSLTPLMVLIYGIIKELVGKDKTRSQTAIDKVISTRV
ncbi:MAG: MurR/RpiR family transcriptional regulator [Melioribacteraceae bacterium]|nr:MurR/RpiR family transcriptional regulator [Melioribacteraceae bacterium]